MARIPFNKNTLGKDDIDAAMAVLDSGMLTMSERCRALESAFAEIDAAPSAASAMIRLDLGQNNLRRARARR
jgi:dTDP-4-amino-4,6-dideoxygalactose transaminase